MDEEEWSKELEANRKPGQKHPTPSPGFADRVFYESLLQQIPTSKMARKWCVEYGVLEWDEAEKICKHLGIQVKVEKNKKSITKSKKNKKAKIVNEPAYDTGLGHSSMMETVGSSGI